MRVPNVTPVPNRYYETMPPVVGGLFAFAAKILPQVSIHVQFRLNRTLRFYILARARNRT